MSEKKTFCHNCGEYSYREPIFQPTCPYCGHYFIISDIKWLFKIFVIFIILVGFIGCLDKAGNSSKQDTVNQTYQQNK